MVNKSSVEESLLLRSHNKERANELLASRYSLSGDQKPFLVLTPTKGNKKTALAPDAGNTTSPSTKAKSSIKPDKSIESNKNKSNGKKIRKRVRSSQFGNAREALSRYISNAKRAQRVLMKRLNKKRKLKDENDNGNRGNTKCNQNEYKISTEVPQYKDFEQLHSLWKEYMTDLIYGTNNNNTNTSPVDRGHAIIVAGKLATADYHGAKLTVIASHNPSLVGIRGIVVWEAKSSFVLVVEGGQGQKQIGGLRIVGKKGTQFKVTVYRNEADAEGEDFTIIGSRFLYRTADRSSRKFKSHNVEDL